MARRPLVAERRSFAEIVALVRAARFTDAAQSLDAAGYSGATGPDAIVLRSRIALKRDPAGAVAFLARHDAALREGSSRHQGMAAILAGLAFARLGDPAAAAAGFERADSHARADRVVARELAYARGQAKWIERDLDGADRALAPLADASVADAPADDVTLEVFVLRGAIAAARGNLREQGAILLEARRIAAHMPDPQVLHLAVIASQLAYLAREIAGTALRDAATEAYAHIAWTDDIAEFRFTMGRALAWRCALDGDMFTTFRRLKEAATFAPSAAWAVMASADRAYFATVVGEPRWAEQELSDANELAARVAWQSLVGEERFALLVLAELYAPRDPSLALAYVARYKGAGTQFDATLASRDDRRVAAQEAYAFGIVQRALGYVNDAERLLRGAYETYDAIGYDWRAARAALALAEIDPDSSWRDLAETKLRPYPASWLVKSIASAPLVEGAPSGARSRVARALERLTPAQAEVYRLLVRGRTTTEIADDRGCSESTIRNHIKVIFKVFRVRSRPALVAAANGFVVETEPEANG